MKFNVNLYKLSVLLNYGFLRVKPNKQEVKYNHLWSKITDHDCFEYLSDLDEVYALKIEGGRRGQIYYIYTLPKSDGSIIFVVDSSNPDGSGSYAVLPSVLLKMYEDKIIVL